MNEADRLRVNLMIEKLKRCKFHVDVQQELPSGMLISATSDDIIVFVELFDNMVPELMGEFTFKVFWNTGEFIIQSSTVMPLFQLIELIRSWKS